MIYVVIATTKERRQRLEKCLAALRESTMAHAVVIYENTDGGCVKATRRAIEGIEGPMFLLNDDMIVEPDCIEKLFNRWMALRDGEVICQPWEKMHGGNLAVAPFGLAKTIRPFLEHYTHNFWDTELTMVKTAFAKYVPVLEARLIHEHFSQGMAPLDETYKLTQGKYLDDQKIFRARMANKFGIKS